MRLASIIITSEMIRRIYINNKGRIVLYFFRMPLHTLFIHLLFIDAKKNKNCSVFSTHKLTQTQKIKGTIVLGTLKTRHKLSS